MSGLVRERPNSERTKKSQKNKKLSPSYQDDKDGGRNCSFDDKKYNKPLIEQRRRNRINACIIELKELLSSASELPNNQKLEKADILEVTVQFLKTIQAKGNSRFQKGFTHCASETDKFLRGIPDLPSGIPEKLDTHLRSIKPRLSRRSTGPVPIAPCPNIDISSVKNATVTYVQNPPAQPPIILLYSSNATNVSSLQIMGMANNQRPTSAVHIVETPKQLCMPCMCNCIRGLSRTETPWAPQNDVNSHRCVTCSTAASKLVHTPPQEAKFSYKKRPSASSYCGESLDRNLVRNPQGYKPGQMWRPWSDSPIN